MSESEDNFVKPKDFTPRSARQPRATSPSPRRKGIIGAAIILLLAAGAIFLLASTRTVLLEAQPETAEFKVAGPTAFVIGDRLFALSGTYPMTVRAPGYHDELIDFVVDEETRRTLQVDLKKLPGIALFEISQISDAEVRVDGRTVGEGGMVRAELEPGAHQVEVRHPRYRPFDFALDIEGMGIEQPVPVTLTRAWVNLALHSEPEGAAVIVVGEAIGTTPFTAELMPGAYEARYRLEGYEDGLQLVEAERGNDRELAPIILTPAKATLSISTRPADAMVYVDGAYIGTSPLSVAVAPGRKAAVKVTKPGYADAARRLTTKTGEQRKVNFDLQEQHGTVRFMSQPEAAIWVNGSLGGETPIELSLQTVPQKVEFRLSGHRTIARTVEPQTTGAQQIAVRLLTESQAIKAEARAEYRTSAGSEMLLVKPGAAQMGSPAGELGRRPNEIQYGVVLTRWFYVSKHEITQRQFSDFGSTQGIRLRPGNPDVPIVSISWQIAAHYCNWLSARENLTPAYRVKNSRVSALNPNANGYRLLTEAEWSWIARVGGARGGEQLKFPWGSAEAVARGSGNYADESAKSQVKKIIKGYRDRFATLAPVGQFGPNALGIYDLGGNASEWVNDFYDYSPKAPGVIETDPTGPAQGLDHVVRGSGWRSANTRELRFAYREFSSDGADDIGFRIGRWLE